MVLKLVLVGMGTQGYKTDNLIILLFYHTSILWMDKVSKYNFNSKMHSANLRIHTNFDFNLVNELVTYESQ